MKHKLTCYQCNSTFESITFRQRFCSRSCTAKFSHIGRKQKNYSNCQVCNFSLRAGQKKFCSHSCSATITNKNRKRMTNDTKSRISSSLKHYNKNTLKRQQKENKSYISFCKICSKCIPNPTSYQLKCCSVECKHIAQSNSGKKGGKKSASIQIKRSKDEIKLYNLCATYFKNIQHNIQIIEGWDADIIIPIHKIAILWNGPWHYKQLPLKNHSLSQVQNRDRIKLKLLKEQGWNVLVFEDRYFTPESAFECIKIWLRNQTPTLTM